MSAKHLKLTVSCGHDTRIVNICDILYFEAFNGKIIMHYQNLNGSSDFAFYGTMNDLERELSGHGFCRVHRSFMVSLGHLSQVNGSNIRLECMEDTDIPVGACYLKNLRDGILKTPAIHICAGARK